MPEMRKSCWLRGLDGAAVLALLALPWCAQASGPRHSAVLATADVRIELSAGDNAPRLTGSFQSGGLCVAQPTRKRRCRRSVEVDGATIPVIWQLKPEQGSADAHHVVFVYESAQPHLRLRWQWEARAGFGPVEHRITI